MAMAKLIRNSSHDYTVEIYFISSVAPFSSAFPAIMPTADKIHLLSELRQEKSSLQIVQNRFGTATRLKPLTLSHDYHLVMTNIAMERSTIFYR